MSEVSRAPLRELFAQAAVIAAALGLGAAENMAGFILGAEFQLAFVYGLLVVILVWRSWRLARERKVLR